MTDSGHPGSEPGWFQLVLPVPGVLIEDLVGWLFEAGAAGTEQRDEECLDPPNLPPGWVELRASFPQAAAARADGLRAELEAAVAGRVDPADRARCRSRIVDLDPQDWANNWRAHFHPIRVGRFWIHPGWIEPDPAEAFAVRIDPGLAFGTGLHPTTRMCLAGLEHRLQAGPLASVFDVGCGSGVLALSAARAGVARVAAADLDPEACRVTRENLILNGLADRVEVIAGGAEAVEERFELVLANILSSVLIEMRLALLARVAPGGRLVLSGILAAEADEVERAFVSAGAVPAARLDEEGWSGLELDLLEPAG